MRKEEYYDYTDESSLIEKIINLQRGITLKVRFNYRNGYKKERIENFLIAEFTDYTIGISSIEPIILYIYKRITDEEIEANIDFFTQCAIDYDILATSLMNMLIQKHKLKVNWDFPILSFRKLGRKTKSKLNGWRYFLHGGDFCFEELKTKQKIEASVVCSDQFGALDPYFFSKYIISSPKYQPLPIEIYDEYGDGSKILDIMEKHYILKKIKNNWGFNRHVLSTNDTSLIKRYIPIEVEPKKKFNLLSFLRLKRS